MALLDLAKGTSAWTPLLTKLKSTVVLLLFLNAHSIWRKSAIRSNATECHRLVALAVFSKKMALKRDCTFSLSW